MQWLWKSEPVTYSLLPELSTQEQAPALCSSSARPILLCSQLQPSVEKDRKGGGSNTWVHLHVQAPSRDWLLTLTVFCAQHLPMLKENPNLICINRDEKQTNKQKQKKKKKRIKNKIAVIRSVTSSLVTYIQCISWCYASWIHLHLSLPHTETSPLLGKLAKI